MAHECVIDVQGLWTQLGGKFIHRGIDLCVHPDEVLALIGESGSGKTTLMRLMLGLDTPARGSIRVFGTPLQELRPGSAAAHAPALGRAVPGGRSVLGAERLRQRRAAAARAARPARGRGARAGHDEARAGGDRRRQRRQAAGAAVGRHGQARGAGARAGARSRAAVPRRADGRPRSGAQRRLRAAYRAPAPGTAPHRGDGHARREHPDRAHRPRGGAGRPAPDRGRAAVGRGAAGPPVRAQLLSRPPGSAARRTAWATCAAR